MDSHEGRRRSYPGARPDWVHRTYWRLKDGLLRAVDPQRGRRVRVRFPFGAAAELDLSLRNEWVLYRTLREHRSYEPELSGLVEQLVQPGSTFIDGGANSGWYTLLAASRVGPSGRVWAVEASPIAWGRLTRNLELNPELSSRVTLVHAAFTEKSGARARIYLGAKRDECSSLHRPELGEGIEVPTVGLRDLNPPPHSIVKLDIEGSEYAVWDGWDHSVPLNWLIEWEPAMEESVRELAARLRGKKVWAVLPGPRGFRLEEVAEEWPRERLNLYVPEA